MDYHKYTYWHIRLWILLKNRKPSCPTSNSQRQNQQTKHRNKCNNIHRRLQNRKRTNLYWHIYVSPNENWHYRLSDNIYIFAAEMMAIKRAAEIFQHKQNNNNHKLIICTDSFSGIQSIQPRRSISNPNILINTLNAIHQTQSPTTIIWIPSHIGIQDKESADKLAALTTNKPCKYRHLSPIWNPTYKPTISINNPPTMERNLEITTQNNTLFPNYP